jgi:hypothetical protein
MATQLSQLIVPAVFGQTVLEDSIQKNVLTTSGIIPVSPLMSAFMAGAGQIYTLPTLINPDLGQVASNVPSGDSAVQATPEVVTGRSQKFIKNARNRSFNVNGLVTNVIGVDPLDALVASTSLMINQWRQRSLVAQLNGLLDPATGVAKANTLKIASESVAGAGAGTKISTNPTSSILDALYGAWGDAGTGDTVLIMHSDVWRTIAKTNTTAFVVPSIQNPQFKSFIGYPVLVDDNLGKRAGTTDGFVYTIYAIKAGAVLFGYTPDAKPFEIFPQPLQGNGAGGEIAVARDWFGYHVTGTSFTGSAAGDVPTDTELATMAKWGLTFPNKAVGIAALIVNL